MFLIGKEMQVQC